MVRIPKVERLVPRYTEADFAMKYLSCSIFRDVHVLQTLAPLIAQHVGNNSQMFDHLRNTR